MSEVWFIALSAGVLIGGMVAFAIAMVREAERHEYPHVSICTEPGCRARFLDQRGLDMHRVAAHPNVYDRHE
jgi:hypothetical protein